MSTAARVKEPPSAAEGPFERILLASEGRTFSDAAIARVVELARSSDASVRVFSIARVHGVAFGMQTPGLLPTKAEWAEQREIVDKAVKRLERKRHRGRRPRRRDPQVDQADPPGGASSRPATRS